MKKSFEIDRSTDPELLDVTLSDESEFSVEITGSTHELTKSNRAAIETFIRGYNNHHSRKLDFHVDTTLDKYVRIVGNLPKILEFLKGNRCISETLYRRINSENDIENLLARSSSYIEPTQEDKVEMPELHSDDEMMQDNTKIHPNNSEPVNSNPFFNSTNSQPTQTQNADNHSRPSSPPTIKVK